MTSQDARELIHILRSGLAKLTIETDPQAKAASLVGMIVTPILFEAPQRGYLWACEALTEHIHDQMKIGNVLVAEGLKKVLGVLALETFSKIVNEPVVRG